MLADPAVVDDEPVAGEQCAAARGRSCSSPRSGAATGPGEHDPLRFAAALRDILATPQTGPVTRGRMTAMAMTAKVKDELSRLG